MTTKLLIFPLFLIILTGCPEENKIKSINNNELELLETCIKSNQKKGLPIDICSKQLDKTNTQKRSSNTKKLLETKKKPSELEKLDKCIELKQKRNLPTASCFKSLKK